VPRRPTRLNTGDLIEYTGRFFDRNPKPGQEQCIGVVVSVHNNGRDAKVLWPIPDETGDYSSRVSVVEIASSRKEMCFLHYPKRKK